MGARESAPALAPVTLAAVLLAMLVGVPALAGCLSSGPTAGARSGSAPSAPAPSGTAPSARAPSGSAPSAGRRPSAAQIGTSGTAVAQAQAKHEYPSGPAPAQRVPDAPATAVSAVAAFAAVYINWNAGDVVARLRLLATQSVGQARSSMALAAAQVAGDYELRRGGIANHGTVEAIAPLAGRVDRFVVVTRELTTATASTAYQGLRPGWHVAIATVARLRGGGWALSGWQPEN